MPDESDPAAWKAFKDNPERKFLDVVSTRVSEENLNNFFHLAWGATRQTLI